MLEASASLAALPGVRICLLNAPSLSRADGALHVLERKEAALIALLALDGPTQRSRVAARLWPDASESQARNNLRQRLFRLRRQAGCEVVRDDGALRLADDVGLDITEALRALQADAGAAAGELLGSHDYAEHEELESWVGMARERWRADRARCIAQRASELEARHEIAAALAYAQRLVREEPLVEHAHRRLMRLHYLRGDRAAATAAFAHCRMSLHAELAIEPDDETLQLARLIESGRTLGQPRPALRPIGVLRPPRLVGREPQWHRLQAVADGAGAALILGEAGIGKSRLLGDFSATSRCAVACNARPGDASLPFALLARLVRALVQAFGPPRIDWSRQELARIVPELGAAPAGELAALRLQQALLQTLTQAREAGLALVAVDDLHFADASSLELLPTLLAAGRELRLAWLLASRVGEMPSALRGWLDSDQSAGVERLVLGPLDAPSVQAVLDSLAIPGFDAAAWAPALTRHTGGNPMFLLETLIALLDRDPAALGGPPRDLPAPAQVGELIERRLQQLGPSALKLARLAALAGQNFSVELAADVLGRHALDIADDWRELESALVIRDDAFAHDLIFEATLRSVPAVIARALHRSIAAHLQQRGAAPAHVAQHWFEAGAWASAAASWVAAAGSAKQASRRSEEADCWERAIDDFERAGDAASAFAARAGSIDALLTSRPIEAALAVVERLEGDAVNERQRIDACLARADASLLAMRTHAALDAAREALALARKLGLTEREFDAARTAALALAQGQRAAEALELLRPLAARVDSAADTAQQHAYWREFAYVAGAAQRRLESAQALMKAIALADVLGNKSEAASSASNLAGTLGLLGRTDEGRQQAERARRYAAELGDSGSAIVASIDMNLGMLSAASGRFGEALALLDGAQRKLDAGAAPAWQAACRNHLANTWLMLGQPARARQALPGDDAAQPFGRVRRLTIESRLLRLAGSAAQAPLQEAMKLLEQRDEPVMRLLVQLERSRALPGDEAVDACGRVLEEALSLELFAIATTARLLAVDARCRASPASGDVGDAYAQAAAALAQADPQDLYRPEAWWILHRGFEQAGDRSAALDALARAAHWVRAVALPNVPDEFRDGFLHRNPVNRAVLAAASRLLPPPT